MYWNQINIHKTNKTKYTLNNNTHIIRQIAYNFSLYIYFTHSRNNGYKNLAE